MTGSISGPKLERTDMGTYSLKPKDIEEKWHVVDADGQALGRLASQVAATLRGKNRPTFTPSMPNGDFVIVVNAAKVKVTGDTREKKYWRHSQYPGGLKNISQEKLLATRPERVIEYAVKGMLPHNSLGARLLKRLKVYAGPEHPHQSQVNAGSGKPRSTASA
jgi:large subunit ribosomal protein L13